MKNFVITLLIILNLGILFKFKYTQGILNAKNESLNKENNFIEGNYQEHILKENYEFESSNLMLCDTMTLFDEFGNKFNIGQIVNNRNLMVLKFSEISCDICVDSITSILKNYIEDKYQSQIIVISNYSHPKYIFRYRRLNDVNFSVYTDVYNNFELPVDSLDTPYLFILNEYLQVMNVFIPLKRLPDQSINYFSSIIRILDN